MQLYVYYWNNMLNPGLYRSDDGENFLHLSNNERAFTSSEAKQYDARYEKYDPTIHVLDKGYLRNHAHPILKQQFFKEVLSE